MRALVTLLLSILSLLILGGVICDPLMATNSVFQIWEFMSEDILAKSGEASSQAIDHPYTVLIDVNTSQQLWHGMGPLRISFRMRECGELLQFERISAANSRTNSIFTWTGKSLNYGFISLQVHENRMMATIWFDGNVYEVKYNPEAQSHQLSQVKIPNVSGCFMQEVKTSNILNTHLHPEDKTQENIEIHQHFEQDSYNVVDIMIAYHKDLIATEYVENIGGIKVLANRLISTANGIFAVSGAKVKLRLVKLVSISYNRSQNLSVILKHLYFPNYIRDHKSPLTKVAQGRFNCSADLVAIIQPFTDVNQFTGAAYLNPGGGGNGLFGYSISALIGNIAFDEINFTHEIGHNFGLMHSYIQDYEYRKTLRLKTPYYGWGHYFGPGSPNSEWKYGTVMTYARNRVPFFSNPNINYSIQGVGAYSLGKSSGEDRAESWLAINQIKGEIADYYPIAPYMHMHPRANSGKERNFLFGVTNYIGCDNITTMEIVFGNKTNRSKSISIMYDNIKRKFYLLDDAGNNWGDGAVLPVDNYFHLALENSRVELHLTNASISASGPSLTLSPLLKFKDTFEGTHGIYMKVTSKSNKFADPKRLIKMGEYTVKINK